MIEPHQNADADAAKSGQAELRPATENGAGAVQPAPADGKSSARTCIGCGERTDPEAFVRLVIGPSGEVAVDAAGGGFGHGAYVHARGPCVAQAVVRGLPRITKGQASSVHIVTKEAGALESASLMPLTAESLAACIQAAMNRRVAGLLTTAVRTRNAVVGSDAVTSAWRAGEATLVVVATDAAAASELPSVREAVDGGSAVAWGTKQSLAAALQRSSATEGVAVAAVKNSGIANALRDAVEKAVGVTSALVPARRVKVSQGRRRDDERSPDDPSKSHEKVAAPKGGFRGKVVPDRAGRASGRHLRRTQESRQ
ncbi:MAG: DUF448 domain-containing protein [Polyangiaceae bacterium]|nr:DUF448 domain-containing protein [Polyangiaceae bacterium]